MKNILKNYLHRYPLWKYVTFVILVLAGICRFCTTTNFHPNERFIWVIVGLYCLSNMIVFIAGFITEVANSDIWFTSKNVPESSYSYDDVGAILIVGTGRTLQRRFDFHYKKEKATIVIYSKRSNILMQMTWNSHIYDTKDTNSIRLGIMDFNPYTVIYFMSQTKIGLYITEEIMNAYEEELREVIRLYDQRILICCKTENGKRSCFLTYSQYKLKK